MPLLLKLSGVVLEFCPFLSFYFLTVIYLSQVIHSNLLSLLLSRRWKQWLLTVGFQAIAEALGLAGLKAVIAISAIIAGGRLIPYCILMDGLAKAGHLQEAKSIFDEMNEKHVKSGL